MVAGAAAGMVEHLSMYPIDTIKTRMQALSQPGAQLSNSTLLALRTVVRREGMLGLYKGFNAMAWGVGPAHAVYFATYEGAKEALGGNQPGHQVLATGAAGALATVAADAVMTPLDVVKQRLQLANTPYKGMLDCFVKMLKHEGPGAFYRSYQTTLVMNIPFTAVHFATYESSKLSLNMGEEDEGIGVQMTAGGLAGGAAAAITNPLDVAKTRLQTEGVSSKTRYGGGVSGVLRQIYREEGLGGLMRGLRPRVMFHVPAAAVCWATYEYGKALLGAK